MSFSAKTTGMASIVESSSGNECGNEGITSCNAELFSCIFLGAVVRQRSRGGRFAIQIIDRRAICFFTLGNGMERHCCPSVVGEKGCLCLCLCLCIKTKVGEEGERARVGLQIHQHDDPTEYKMHKRNDNLAPRGGFFTCLFIVVRMHRENAITIAS